MINSSPPGSPRSDLWNPNRAKSKRDESIVKVVFGAFALLSIGTTIGILYTLIFEMIKFFRQVPITNFLFDTEWTPLFTNPQYGIFVLISATFLTSFIALLVAVPLGILAAICLSEYAPRSVRAWLKPALELLAGVPSVVFGYFALLFVTPFLRNVLGFDLQTFNGLSAGLILGISILPIIASLSEDAIYAVPDSLRQASYAVGATKRETVINVVLKAALSGIVAAVILGVSRAVGETMIVTLAAGQNPTLTLDPRVAIQTMTAFIVQVSGGDVAVGTLKYDTLFAVGFSLFLITLILNVFSFWFVRRFQEKYE